VACEWMMRSAKDGYLCSVMPADGIVTTRSPERTRRYRFNGQLLGTTRILGADCPSSRSMRASPILVERSHDRFASSRPTCIWSSILINPAAGVAIFRPCWPAAACCRSAWERFHSGCWWWGRLRSWARLDRSLSSTDERGCAEFQPDPSDCACLCAILSVPRQPAGLRPRLAGCCWQLACQLVHPNPGRGTWLIRVCAHPPSTTISCPVT
jgi:hypothetical protein